MKALYILLLVGTLSIVCDATGSTISFTLDKTATGTTYRVNDKLLSPADFSALLVKMIALQKDQEVWIRCSERDTTADLFPMLDLIRKAGFNMVLISYPARKSGRTGTQFSRIQLAEPPQDASSCTGALRLDAGFLAEPNEIAEVPTTNQKLSK